MIFSRSHKILNKILSLKPTQYTILYNKFYPNLCDVSLDNIRPSQSITSKKINTIHNICLNEYPQSIKIGNLDDTNNSNYINDTTLIHNYTTNILKQENYSIKKIFVGVNSITSLQNAIQNNVTNISLYTSISNKYHVHYTKKSLNETKMNLFEIFETLKYEKNYNTFYKKLHISCINYCPFMGKINNDYILKEILEYNKNYDLDEICLTDKFGIITPQDLKYIIKTLPIFGIPISKLSLQLYVSHDNIDSIEDCIRISLREGIHKFDVSYTSDKLPHVLTYDMFYKILFKHIDACYT